MAWEIQCETIFSVFNSTFAEYIVSTTKICFTRIYTVSIHEMPLGMHSFSGSLYHLIPFTVIGYLFSVHSNLYFSKVLFSLNSS